MSIANSLFLLLFPVVAGQLLALTIVYAAFGHRYTGFWDYVKSFFRED